MTISAEIAYEFFLLKMKSGSLQKYRSIIQGEQSNVHEQ